jgi:hypothetical protein
MQRRILNVILFALCCICLGLTPFAASSAIETPTATPTLRLATPSLIAEQRRISMLKAKYTAVADFVGVGYMRAYPSHDKQDFIVYIEGFTKRFANPALIATRLREITIQALGFEPSKCDIVLFDGHAADTYHWNGEAWDIGIATLEPEVRDSWLLTATALIPTPTPTPKLSCPLNCQTAIARGMSDEQAAFQCPKLDEDHDGVACYGD